VGAKESRGEGHGTESDQRRIGEKKERKISNGFLMGNVKETK